MDERTLTALQASIKHWEENAAATDPKQATLGIKNCPLCREFFAADCNGCPVKERTGRLGCCGTPYSKAWESHRSWEEYPDDYECFIAFQSAAIVEVEFLRSLLPTTTDGVSDADISTQDCS